ncbi:MAG: hypothetical protein V4603_03405 [Pseudomonadota bacterium]
MSVRSRQILFALPVLVLITGLLANSHIARSAGETPFNVLKATPAARIVSAPIGEMSGIVKSPRRENTYWVHNDSGDTARIFAITAEGKSILPTYSKFTNYGDEEEDGKQQWQGFEVLQGKNVDWEDIAIDANYLYLADTGNNGNARRDLGIYLISEIDPTASTRSAVIQHLPLVYPEQKEFPPEQKHFDSESLFDVDGVLYLITKHRAPGILGSFEPGANLYRLDTRYTDKPNVLTKVDANFYIFAATGADLSPDGQTLAVTSMSGLWLFPRPATGDQWLSGAGRYYEFDRDAFKQLEAVTWIDDSTLLLGNEQRDLFHIPLATLPEAVEQQPAPPKAAVPPP